MNNPNAFARLIAGVREGKPSAIRTARALLPELREAEAAELVAALNGATSPGPAPAPASSEDDHA